MVPCDWARMTYPIFLVDAASGETIHVIRLGKEEWAKNIRARLSVHRNDYHVSQDEQRLLISIAEPVAVVVDLRDMKTIYEPYLHAWWFMRKPRLMKRFEKMGGAMGLMKAKFLDKEIGWLPWRGMIEGGYGGFPDNNHVLISAEREARMYDLKTGDLVAREENPYVLKSLFEQTFGFRSKLRPLGVSSVKLPPAPFMIVGNILARHGGWGWLSGPNLDSGAEAFPYPRDYRRIVCRLTRVSSRDAFILPYDYLENFVPEWSGFSGDGWPVPTYSLGRMIVREDRGRIEEIVGGSVIKTEPSPSRYFAVDPGGRFVVLPYNLHVVFRKNGRRDVFWFFFVVWFDLRSGRVLRWVFPEVRESSDVLGVYVFPGGDVVVYCTGQRVFVFDSSFRLVRWLRRFGSGEGDRLREEFNRAAGVRGFFNDNIAVSPDLRRVVVPFFRDTEEFEKAGVFKDGLPGEFLDDSCYFGLSERARRDFRTLYLAFYDWDWGFEGFTRIYDEEERYLCLGSAVPFWF